MHAESGQSKVESDAFFVLPGGKENTELEKVKFLQILQSSEAQSLACQFPARYKWLKTQYPNIREIDLGKCTELQQYLKNFQRKDFYIAYVSEFLDAPASAFGHLMLVFHDGSTSFELADTIHFAASTNREGAFDYAFKGLTGRFDGYYIREPLFIKKKDYLLIEQRAIHLYKLRLTETEIDNMVLHLYELRKAKFKYYFVDENCAYQLAELLNVASPDKDYRIGLNQPILPLDVVRLHKDQIIQHTTLAPTVTRQNTLTAQLTADELEHVKSVINQKSLVSSEDSDQLKELLYLHYQYAFRRKHNAYPNHSEVEQLKFTESTRNLDLPDPIHQPSLSTWSVDWVSSSQRAPHGRIQWTPLGNPSSQAQVESESRLSLLETTVDLMNSEPSLYRLKLISMTSTPNNLDLHHPWSWRIDIGANRDNSLMKLASEAEMGVGKTWVHHGYRIESWLGAGVNQMQESRVYVKPQISVSKLLTENTSIGISSYKKQLSEDKFQSSEVTLQYKNIQLQHRKTGRSETNLMVHLPF
jgi:hypothetical protein